MDHAESQAKLFMLGQDVQLTDATRAAIERAIDAEGPPDFGLRQSGFNLNQKKEDE